jgi:exodeoxyribonuclease VII small subunit
MLKRVRGSLRPNLAVKNRMAKKDQSDRKFESALEELEGVIEQLESGNLSLEDSLAAFEKGVGLVKYCNQKLSEVEQKVELLIKDKEGRLQLKLLDSLVNPEGKDEENE